MRNERQAYAEHSRGKESCVDAGIHGARCAVLFAVVAVQAGCGGIPEAGDIAGHLHYRLGESATGSDPVSEEEKKRGESKAHPE